MNSKIYNKASALRRKAGQESLHAFAKLYLSEHVHIAPSNAHLEIYKVLYDMVTNRGKKVAIAAPRDFGKSTMITLAYIIYLICYAREHFIVIISNTASQARKILDNVRSELTENEALRRDFPEIFESNGKPKPPRWTNDDIITRNNVEILALGYGQQIRGRKHGHHRPTLVIMDDIEDGENTFSPETKEKMKRWLERSVLKVGSSLSNFLFIGTVHNSFSLLGDYLSSEVDPSWIGKKYKAVKEWPENMHTWEHFWKIRSGKEVYNNAKGPLTAQKYYQDNKLSMDKGAVILWPQKWNLCNLMEMHAENELSFRSEMQNEPIDTDKMSFDVDNFTYMDSEYPSVDALLRTLGNKVSFCGACDPALMGGDYSAIIVLAIHGDDYYVIVADIARKDQDKLIKDILAYAKRYEFSSFAVEANSFQELMVSALEKEARAQGVFINLTPIKNSGHKQQRILSLYSWVKNGSIKFCKSDKLLLDQFRMFPRGKHDDGPDALEMAMRVSHECHRGDLEILSTDKKDIYRKYYAQGDIDYGEYDEYLDDRETPSSNAREIEVL